MDNVLFKCDLCGTKHASLPNTRCLRCFSSVTVRSFFLFENRFENKLYK